MQGDPSFARDLDLFSAHFSEGDDTATQFGGTIFAILFVICQPPPANPLFRTKCQGVEHRRGEGSETFLERKWVLRRFPGDS